MSFQITTAFVDQYSSNVQMLVQQKGSVLRGLVLQESVKAKEAYFEQIGSVAAVKKRRVMPIRRVWKRRTSAVV